MSAEYPQDTTPAASPQAPDFDAADWAAFLLNAVRDRDTNTIPGNRYAALLEATTRILAYAYTQGQQAARAADIAEIRRVAGPHQDPIANAALTAIADRLAWLLAEEK